MSKITIHRTSDFINLIRKIGIYNNDEKIGEIRNGETKEFTVQAGVLNLSARIDWQTSETITVSIADGEERTFKLSSRDPENPFAVSLAKDSSLYLRLEE